MGKQQAIGRRLEEARPSLGAALAGKAFSASADQVPGLERLQYMKWMWGCVSEVVAGQMVNMTLIARLKRIKQKTNQNFRFALLAVGFRDGRTLGQGVVDSLVGAIVVTHKAKRIRSVELVDFVQVAARRVPNGLLGFDLGMIHLLRRCCRGDVSGIVERSSVRSSRATGEGGVLVTAATVTFRSGGGGEGWLRRERGPAPSPALPPRWIVRTISQPFVVTVVELWIGRGNRRGTHPGEISARRQMWIVPGVDGEGWIIIVVHFFTVVEIVLAVFAVVVEKLGFAPGEWWTLRRKRGAVNPKGGIHRIRGVGGFHQPPLGHR